MLRLEHLIRLRRAISVLDKWLSDLRFPNSPSHEVPARRFRNGPMESAKAGSRCKQDPVSAQSNFSFLVDCRQFCSCKTSKNSTDQQISIQADHLDSPQSTTYQIIVRTLGLGPVGRVTSLACMRLGSNNLPMT